MKVNSWTQKWQESDPEAAGSSLWFRRDPHVLAEIVDEVAGTAPVNPVMDIDRAVGIVTPYLVAAN